MASKLTSALRLCFFFLALWILPSDAFQPRTLSQLPPVGGVVSALPLLLNTSLPINNVTALLASFPANLTGNLTGLLLPNATELAKIQQYVLNVTRPTVASFIDGTNTTIDCVPIQAQLSLINATLTNQTLPLTPPVGPRLNTTTVTSAVPVLNGTIPRIITPAANATALLNRTGLNATCPNGSVPVPRLTVADIARFGSLQAFLNSALNKGPPPNVTAPSSASDGHEYATTSPDRSSSDTPPAFYGMQTSMSVWAPFVDQPVGSREFSLSQVWVTGGTGIALQTIEAGWQVDTVAYGDAKPHLFIFSTRKGYTDPVCYAGRKDCPQGAATFVQVSNSVYPTITLDSSVANGDTVQYTLLVVRDSPTGNWWVKLGSEWVGYYPGNLYTSLAQSADSVALGGEIVDYARLPGAPPGTPHTKTDMGSGEFAAGRSPATVAYHYNMMYVDEDNNLQTLDGIQVVNTNPAGYDPDCYSGQLVSSTTGSEIFFFGGPGFSAVCAI